MSEARAEQLPGPHAILGTFRRFGPVGPVYAVAGVISELDDGDTLMKVTLVESGEDVEYRYTSILDDPVAD
jgi:hypothetical protein